MKTILNKSFILIIAITILFFTRKIRLIDTKKSQPTVLREESSYNKKIINNFKKHALNTIIFNEDSRNLKSYRRKRVINKLDNLSKIEIMDLVNFIQSGHKLYQLATTYSFTILPIYEAIQFTYISSDLYSILPKYEAHHIEDVTVWMAQYFELYKEKDYLESYQNIYNFIKRNKNKFTQLNLFLLAHLAKIAKIFNFSHIDTLRATTFITKYKYKSYKEHQANLRREKEKRESRIKVLIEDIFEAYMDYSYGLQVPQRISRFKTFIQYILKTDKKFKWIDTIKKSPKNKKFDALKKIMDKITSSQKVREEIERKRYYNYNPDAVGDFARSITIR